MARKNWQMSKRSFVAPGAFDFLLSSNHAAGSFDFLLPDDKDDPAVLAAELEKIEAQAAALRERQHQSAERKRNADIARLTERARIAEGEAERLRTERATLVTQQAREQVMADLPAVQSDGTLSLPGEYRVLDRLSNVDVRDSLAGFSFTAQHDDLGHITRAIVHRNGEMIGHIKPKSVDTDGRILAVEFTPGSWS